MAYLGIKESSHLVGYNPTFSPSSIYLLDTFDVIGADIFRNNTDITEITMGSAVVEIRSRAFYGCTNLSSITCPTTLRFIGEAAFDGTGVLSNPYDLNTTSSVLSWKPPTNNPLAASLTYNVYVDNIMAGSTTNTSYSLSSLAPYVTHTLRVAAVANGVEGISSVVISYVRTPHEWQTSNTTPVSCTTSTASASGNRAIVGTPSGAVRIYDRDSDGSWIPGAYLAQSGGSITSISSSANGLTCAFATPENVRVYTDLSGVWHKVLDISGNAGQNTATVSLSADGCTLAMGCQSGDGIVYIYRCYSGLWSIIKTLYGTKTSLEHFGSSVSLSADGSILAVGAKDALGKGAVRIYSGNHWINKVSIYGEDGSNEEFGRSVSLSADGMTMIVGSPSAGTSAAPGGAMQGHGSVSLWIYKENQWMKLDTLHGSAGNTSIFGRYVTMSAAGTTIAVSESTGLKLYSINLGGKWPLINSITADALAVSLSSTGDRVTYTTTSSLSSAEYRTSSSAYYPSYITMMAAIAVNSPLTSQNAAKYIATDINVSPSLSITPIITIATSLMPPSMQASLACLLTTSNLVNEMHNSAKNIINSACIATLQFPADTYILIDSTYTPSLLESIGETNRDITYTPSPFHAYIPSVSTVTVDTSHNDVLYCLAPDVIYTINNQNVIYNRKSALNTLLSNLISAKTFIPPNGTALSSKSREWRLNTFYRQNLSPSASLEECASRLQQEAVSTFSYSTYTTLVWLAADMLMSAETKTVGAAYFQAYLPLALGIDRIMSFCDGGAEETQNFIPAGYFKNAPDRSIQFPLTINLTRTAPIMRIDVGAFDPSVTSFTINSTTYPVNAGSIAGVYRPDWLFSKITYHPELASEYPLDEYSDIYMWTTTEYPRTLAVNMSGATSSIVYGNLQYPSKVVYIDAPNINITLWRPDSTAVKLVYPSSNIKLLMTYVVRSVLIWEHYAQGTIYDYSFVQDALNSSLAIPSFAISESISVSIPNRNKDVSSNALAFSPQYWETPELSVGGRVIPIPDYYNITKSSLANNQKYYFGNMAWINKTQTGVAQVVYDILSSTSTGGIVYLMPDASTLQPFMFREWAPRITRVRTNSLALMYTTIPDFTFKNCTNLIDPGCVGSVGISAFEGCISLPTISFMLTGNSYLMRRAFAYCTGLTSVKIYTTGNLIIHEDAFLGCTGLKSIDLSGTQVTVNSSAFNGCTSLENLSITNLYSNEFTFIDLPALKTVSISNRTSLSTNTMQGLTSLTNVSLISPLISITNDQFNGCSSLRKVNFNGKLPGLAQGVFAGCSSLESLQIIFVEGAQAIFPFHTSYNSLKSIDISGGAIVNLQTYNCPVLSSVSVTCNQIIVGANTFELCQDLSSIFVFTTNNTTSSPVTFSPTIPNLRDCILTGNVEISDISFATNAQHLRRLIIYGVYHGVYKHLSQSTLETLHLRFGTVTDISSYQFVGYSSLKDALFSNIGIINEGAFFGCTQLTSCIFTDATQIHDWVFVNTGLTGTFVIPDTVEYLGRGYLVGCRNLTKILYKCAVTRFIDPTRVTHADWNYLLSNNNTNKYIFNCTAILTARDSNRSYIYEDSLNGGVYTVSDQSLHVPVNNRLFNERNSNMDNVVRELKIYYAEDASSSWIATYLVDFKDLATECINTMNRVGSISSFLGWDGQYFTTMDNAAISSLKPYQYSAYRSRIYPGVSNIFAQVISTNDTLLASTTEPTSSYPNPYTIPMTSFSMNISHADLTGIIGNNVLVIENNDLRIKWSNAKVIYNDDASIDISGSLICSLTANIAPRLDTILKWIVQYTAITYAASSVALEFNNTYTSILHADYKTNTTIDISSTMISILPESLTGLSNTTVNMTGTHGMIDNEACIKCSNTTFNLSFKVTPNVGINIFHLSDSITINSSNFLINTPILRIIDIADITLDQVPAIIEQYTDVSADSTRNVEFGTCILPYPSNISIPPYSYAYIKFQALPSLKIYILMQKQ